MKPVAKIVLATALLVSLGLLLHAEPVSQLKPTNYVNDFAGVLNPTTVAQLNSICQQIDEKAHAQIAVVTIKSLDGSDIESYAVALFKQWGIGSKATDHGVLILLATQDRRYRVEVGYGLEPILPDGKVGGFGREAVPLLKQNDYDGAMALLTMRVADVIAQDAGIQLTGSRPRAPYGAARAEQGIVHRWNHFPHCHFSDFGLHAFWAIASIQHVIEGAAAAVGIAVGEASVAGAGASAALAVAVRAVAERVEAGRLKEEALWFQKNKSTNSSAGCVRRQERISSA